MQTNLVADDFILYGNTTIGKPKTMEVKPKPIMIPMICTGYDLGVQSCGKSYNNPNRGITRSGKNINGLSREQVLIVASTRYKIGTKLKIIFPKGYEQYNNIYTVEDHGNFPEDVLDLYIGDFGEQTGQETISFGRVSVKVEILK